MNFIVTCSISDDMIQIEYIFRSHEHKICTVLLLNLKNKIYKVYLIKHPIYIKMNNAVHTIMTWTSWWMFSLEQDHCLKLRCLRNCWKEELLQGTRRWCWTKDTTNSTRYSQSRARTGTLWCRQPESFWIHRCSQMTWFPLYRTCSMVRTSGREVDLLSRPANVRSYTYISIVVAIVIFWVWQRRLEIYSLHQWSTDVSSPCKYLYHLRGFPHTACCRLWSQPLVSCLLSWGWMCHCKSRDWRN
jgi:hypothetical protein